MRWRPCRSEDGVLMKMEMPWLKLQATIKEFNESTAEMDGIGNVA